MMAEMHGEGHGVHGGGWTAAVTCRGWADGVGSAAAWVASMLGLRYILWGGGGHADGVWGCAMAWAWDRCRPGVACGDGHRDVSGMVVAGREGAGCVIIGAGACEGCVGCVWDGGGASCACWFLIPGSDAGDETFTCCCHRGQGHGGDEGQVSQD